MSDEVIVIVHIVLSRAWEVSVDTKEETLEVVECRGTIQVRGSSEEEGLVIRQSSETACR